jgi:23S rRNA pseudouridine1911/1915/1917 synthase
MPRCWSPLWFNTARSSFFASSRSCTRYSNDQGIAFRPFSSVLSVSTVPKRNQTALRPPTVLFQNNHVLAVYKPPGWHSIPHTDGDTVLDTSKCLLTYLCEQKLGGGSQNEYLKPLHRIDQPCSGLLLFGKTTKAASRIQALFNKMSQSSSNGTAALVLQKTYFVMVHSNARVSHSTEPGAWQTLHGGVVARTHRDSRRQHTNSPQKGWSVPMIPLEENQTTETKSQRTILRHCSLRYRPVLTYAIPNTQNRSHMQLLQVQTAQGARHLIRALLSCHGHIVVGDLRYGGDAPLPDQSVALHARSLQFPPSFQLVRGDDPATGHTPLPRILKAPIPPSWETYFRCTQDMIDAWEEEYAIIYA